MPLIGSRFSLTCVGKPFLLVFSMVSRTCGTFTHAEDCGLSIPLVSFSCSLFPLSLLLGFEKEPLSAPKMVVAVSPSTVVLASCSFPLLVSFSRMLLCFSGSFVRTLMPT